MSKVSGPSSAGTRSRVAAAPSAAMMSMASNASSKLGGMLGLMRGYSKKKKKQKKVLHWDPAEAAPPAARNSANAPEAPLLMPSKSLKRLKDTGIQPEATCGHVFLLHCNVQGLAADARLMPRPDDMPAPENGEVVVPVVSRGLGRSKLFAGNISTDDFDDAEKASVEMQLVVKAFLESAGSLLSGKASAFKRAKPLLALPMPGVGLMDKKNLLSDDTLMLWVLPELYRAANAYSVDVALCTTDKRAHYVMNVLRHRCCPFKDGPFWMLSAEHKEQVNRLHGLVRSGRLALLVGAGVSVPSGLPLWGDLLEQLARKAGFNDEEVEQLSHLHYLDQPTLIQERAGGRSPFVELVARVLDSGRYTPAHAILGAMKAPAVTTNYDHLFESAVASAHDDRGASEEVLRLPWDAARLAKAPIDAPRLVKLHGCVSVPASIVLTRQDYMRYEDERRALRGAVHQTLLERELLVVGCSMADDNIHLIVDAVRKALDFADGKNDMDQATSGRAVGYRKGLKDGQSFSMGTILSMVENRMFRQLWSNDFTVVSCADSWADSPAWLHDCFLEMLASEVHVDRAHDSFILDPEYDRLIDETQRQINEALQPLRALADDAIVRQSSSWDKIERLLATYGERSELTNGSHVDVTC